MRSSTRNVSGYGLSETSPVASFAQYGEEPRVGSIGRPIAGVQMKLINDDWSHVDEQGHAGAGGAPYSCRPKGRGRYQSCRHRVPRLRRSRRPWRRNREGQR
jgi:acyl-CoA synthetase (AMP-forming)/AMP-acid ligase II